jgi:LemA protein
MDMSLLLWVIIATLLFWAVGMYNRLMRLRARCIEVLGVVKKHAAACAMLVKQYVEEPSNVGPPSVNSPWIGLHAKAQRLEQFLAQHQPMPLQPDAVSALSNMWEDFQSEWAALCEAPSDLAGPVVPPEMVDAWSATSIKVKSASGGYNQIAAQYNEAIQQYPARWVAGLMGFHLAGSI